MKKLFTGKHAWVTFLVISALLVGGVIYYYTKWLPAHPKSPTTDPGTSGGGTLDNDGNPTSTNQPAAGK